MSLTENHLPLYLQLYWRIKDDILFNELSPGERMPTVEEMHEYYNVSQGTVRNALNLLEREGLIQKKKKVGVFVREDIRALFPSPARTAEDYEKGMEEWNFELLSEGWVPVTKRIIALFRGEENVFRDQQTYQVELLLTNKLDNRGKIYAKGFIPAWMMSLIEPNHLQRIVTKGFILLSDQKKTRRLNVLTRPWVCNAGIAEKLGLVEGSPAFRRLYTFYAEDNRITAIADIISNYNATEHNLIFER